MPARQRQNNDVFLSWKETIVSRSTCRMRACRLKGLCSQTSDGCVTKRKTSIITERCISYMFYTQNPSIFSKLIFVSGPSVCFQSSDSEVRRLLEQLSQKDKAVQKLQKEKEDLVELSQVRLQQKFIQWNRWSLQLFSTYDTWKKTKSNPQSQSWIISLPARNADSPRFCFLCVCLVLHYEHFWSHKSNIKMCLISWN